MKIHDLKCWSQHFAALKSGEKTFELRNNDRNFRTGEIILLRQWDPVEGYDESEPLTFEITHVIADPLYGVQVGYAALALKPCEAPIEPLEIKGVGRVHDDPRALVMALLRPPTDDELLSIHDWLREWRLP